MYLRRVYIENSAALRALTLDLPISAAGTPKPVVLVGANGSGKTTLLSIVVDALFEAAAVYYSDIVAEMTVTGRPWFRIIGPSTISNGATGGCALLEFEDGEASYLYTEKGGVLSVESVAEKVPEKLKSRLEWPDDGIVKTFSVEDQQSKKIFAEGVYVHLPSSRAEVPHWLNRASLPNDDLDLVPRVTKQLRKPIYVERGIGQLKQWMISLLAETRIDFVLRQTPGGQTFAVGRGDFLQPRENQLVWQALNQIIQLILNDQTARFVWLGRHVPGRIGVESKGLNGSIPLDGLSAGQATLLNIFGTLLRYGDGTIAGATTPDRLVGICVVDEIDAHMHIDLQYRALPELIRMFPKIQFIVSSHSPLFVLGMEKAFSTDGTTILDMPSGAAVNAEAYAEFGRALDVLRDTRAFSEAIRDLTSKSGKLLVLLEGETDPMYLDAATALLDRKALKDHVDFAWIGAKDQRGGQAFNTGKDALNAAANMLKAQPNLIKRPVLLLYDNDTNKATEDHENLFIRSMPTNQGNYEVQNGIENLLPELVIADDMFDQNTSKKKNGNTTISRTLNKMKLCKHVCEVRRNSVDFNAFIPALNLIEEVVASLAKKKNEDAFTQEAAPP
jgi:AAA domain, putative AbiEii toxin, Type IV TA system